MGDFYELFFEDAEHAAAALDIALTKRGKHLGNDIPMCGVPFHAAEGYLLQLIKKGFRVAVCEQMENPAEAKKRGAKSVVKRDVVRLVTPGTLTEDTLLDARAHNYLCAYCNVRDEAALAWVDVSTGHFHVTPTDRAALGPMLSRLHPKELLISEHFETELGELANEHSVSLTPLSSGSFDSTSATARLCKLFGLSSLEGLGTFERAELGAMGAIVDYLEITQRGKLPLLHRPVQETHRAVMQIDAATRRNLELVQSLSGGRAGSLLEAIDRSVTSAGARLLEARLGSPSTRLDLISDRHDAVSFFVENQSLANSIRDRLRQVPDIDRALSRISLDRAGPRDLAAIRNGLTQATEIAEALDSNELPSVVAQTVVALTGHEDLMNLLDDSIVAEPPLLARDGGFIAPGFDTDLDEARRLRDEGRTVVAGMQADFAEQTGIGSLKIKHNNVLGYFIETPATHAEKMLTPPLSEIFIHRQTTANAVRFTTVELSSLETRILNAGSRALEVEKRLFQELCAEILKLGAELSMAAKSIAEIDLAAAFADLAHGENWVRPSIREDLSFEVEGGRHPVVELALKKDGGGSFVPNDCTLSVDDGGRFIWLLTGPNMAGKSTFLRQNALIAILAQAGAYVPARKAIIGLVDQVFSRVGAADDLARGRSTFMVEMVETAAILNQAGPRALVILDEIGRGTATYDGLSIAWATLEHLHDVNTCRALFATHYHELTGLSSKLNGLNNATVTVREWEGDVIFLHEVKPGAADRSYGVQVAKLAGLPNAVVERARIVLEALEKGEQSGAVRPDALMDDLPLFQAMPQSSPTTKVTTTSELESKIAEIHPDDLSPRDALTLIYELKALAKPHPDHR